MKWIDIKEAFPEFKEPQIKHGQETQESGLVFAKIKFKNNHLIGCMIEFTKYKNKISVSYQYFSRGGSHPEDFTISSRIHIPMENIAQIQWLDQAN